MNERALWIAIAACAPALLSATGCGGESSCGPADAPTSGASLTTAGGVLTYGNGRSSPNNDCTPFDGRMPTSITVDLVQTEPAPDSSRFFTLCIPEPDNLGNGTFDLGYETSDADVLLIDVFGQTESGAEYQLDQNAPGLAATVTVDGYCGDGSDPAGFSIAVTGQVPLVVDGTPETAALSGPAVAIEAQDF